MTLIPREGPKANGVPELISAPCTAAPRGYHSFPPHFQPASCQMSRETTTFEPLYRYLQRTPALIPSAVLNLGNGDFHGNAQRSWEMFAPGEPAELCGQGRNSFSISQQPWAACPGPDSPFGEGNFPNIQSKP